MKTMIEKELKDQKKAPASAKGWLGFLYVVLVLCGCVAIWATYIARNPDLFTLNGAAFGFNALYVFAALGLVASIGFGLVEARRMGPGAIIVGPALVAFVGGMFGTIFVSSELMGWIATLVLTYVVFAIGNAFTEEGI